MNHLIAPTISILFFLHGEQHQTNSNCGKPKERDLCLPKSSSQLQSHQLKQNLATTNMCFNSPCGEMNQLMTSSTTLIHNLQQSKSSATIQVYKPNVFENSTTSPDTNKLLMLNREVTTQLYMFQSTLELHEDTIKPYNNINSRPEYPPNSKYVPLIDPKPPPYMISENISRPKLPGPYTVYPLIINTIVPSTSPTYQYSSRIYILSKKLHFYKERVTCKYWYGMGSDLFLKTLRNSTMTYNFKTKIIVQQFNVQNSSTFEWREVIFHSNNSST